MGGSVNLGRVGGMISTVLQVKPVTSRLGEYMANLGVRKGWPEMMAGVGKEVVVQVCQRRNTILSKLTTRIGF